MNKAKLSVHGLFLAVGIAALVIHGCHTDPHGHANLHERPSGHGDSSFVARHIKKQASITLNGTIDVVWPLFDPLNEGKWAPAWRPEILYPTDGTVQEGMVVRTHGMQGDQGKLVWTVTRYDPGKHHITYTVTNPERTFMVDVQCSEHGASYTDATITYRFVGLTDLGNQVSERSAERLFRSDLKDWQEAINHYLKTGKPN